MVSFNKRTLVLVSCAVLASAASAAAGQGEHTFVLTVEGCASDLGTWSKVTGLDVSFDLADYRSDDHTTVYRWFYPVGGPGSALTLSRATSGESEAVECCLRELGRSGEPANATIMLFDYDGQPVATWEFDAAFPQKLIVPGTDAAGSQGMETLVLAHEGLILRSCSDCSR